MNWITRGVLWGLSGFAACALFLAFFGFLLNALGILGAFMGTILVCCVGVGLLASSELS